YSCSFVNAIRSLSTPPPLRSNSFLIFLLLWPPPRSTLFPYTTLFRSWFRFHCTVQDIFGNADVDCIKLDGGISPFHGLIKLLCRSEEHTSELQSRFDLVCRLLLEKKKKTIYGHTKTNNNTKNRHKKEP